MSLKQWADNGWLKPHRTSRKEISSLLRIVERGKIVLVQYRGLADPETGGSFTVKRYRSEKSYSKEGEWKHTKITLEPLNSEFQPVILEPQDEGAIQVIAEYLGTLGK